VQPSQDNRDKMVKKLEKGSTVTSSTPQQHIKIIKGNIQAKKTGHDTPHRPTKLKHSYYNMTEQGSRHYNSNSKHHDNTRYNSCLARRRAVKPTTLTSRRQLGKIDILLLPAVGNLVAH
jgi:hypothetical protein